MVSTYFHRLADLDANADDPDGVVNGVDEPDAIDDGHNVVVADVAAAAADGDGPSPTHLDHHFDLIHFDYSDFVRKVYSL